MDGDENGVAIGWIAAAVIVTALVSMAVLLVKQRRAKEITAATLSSLAGGSNMIQNSTFSPSDGISGNTAGKHVHVHVYESGGTNTYAIPLETATREEEDVPTSRLPEILPWKVKVSAGNTANLVWKKPDSDSTLMSRNVTIRRAAVQTKPVLVLESSVQSASAAGQQDVMFRVPFANNNESDGQPMYLDVSSNV